MAKRPDLTQHQRGIVKRYYASLDSITSQKLQELVSDLYLAAPEEREKLWKRVSAALAKTAARDSRVQRVLDSRDVQALARLVGELA